MTACNPNSTRLERWMGVAAAVMLAHFVATAATYLGSSASIVLILAVCCVACGMGVVRELHRNRVRRRRFEVPPSPIGSVRGGFVRVRGRVLASKSVEAPLTGRRVIWARAKVTEDVGSGQDGVRITHAEEVAGAEFDLDDGTGRVHVRLAWVETSGGIPLRGDRWPDKTYLAECLRSRGLGMEGRSPASIHAHEEVVSPGEMLSASGYATLGPSGLTLHATRGPSGEPVFLSHQEDGVVVAESRSVARSMLPLLGMMSAIACGCGFLLVSIVGVIGTAVAALAVFAAGASVALALPSVVAK